MSKDIIPKSVVRWAGSKRKLLPVLKSLWRSTDGKYIEPFAGSACLFFELRPQSAVLNDANAELISAYEMLARYPRALHGALTKLPVSSDYYYAVRSDTEDERDAFASAVRFFYLNRYCFNGIYRTNRQGKFNVPYGNKTGGFPPRSAWVSGSSALRSATLLSGDFESAVMSNVNRGDFVYMDPPYAVANRRVFVQYSKDEFGASDLERLRKVMQHVHKVGATFVVSYAQSGETARLAEGWSQMRRLTQRNIAGFSEHRRKAVEVMITNDPTRFDSIKRARDAKRASPVRGG